MARDEITRWHISRHSASCGDRPAYNERQHAEAAGFARGPRSTLSGKIDDDELQAAKVSREAVRATGGGAI